MPVVLAGVEWHLLQYEPRVEVVDCRNFST